MQQIQTLLQKLNDLANAGSISSAIEQDLMLDYTRQLYDALLELKQNNITQPIAPTEQHTSINANAAVAPKEIEHQSIPIEITNKSIEVTQEEPQQKTESKIIVEEPELTKVPLSMPEQLNSPDYNAPYLTDFTVSSKDIRLFIGINDKYQFISELFRNNAEAYEEILDEINSFETKQDALYFLNNSGVTTLYGWEDDNFTVILFQNVLNQFFATK